MSSKWQGALITILEALKDVCLVNEAKEKFGPMSEKEKKKKLQDQLGACYSHCLMSFLRLQGN